jgi:hypothetical protein
LRRGLQALEAGLFRVEDASDVCMLRGWIIALLVGLAGAPALSGEAGDRADLLKAGYLLNFVKFVEWPASAPADVLRVCFMGGVGVRSVFAANLHDKRAGSRRLAVRELKSGESVQECDVLYLDGGRGTLQGAATATSAVLSWGILTVGEEANFVRHGGVIGLFAVDNRLRFSINLENARRAGLKISSALLQLASSVEKDAS